MKKIIIGLILVLGLISVVTSLDYMITIPFDDYYNLMVENAQMKALIEMYEQNYIPESSCHYGGGDVSPTNEEEQEELNADITGNRQVDKVDLMVIECNWQQDCSSLSCGDVNSDGIVNDLDLSIVSSQVVDEFDDVELSQIASEC